MTSLALLPAASCAVTVMMFSPDSNGMFGADQLVVPVAVPDPPRLLVHVTSVTATLSLAVPPSVIGVVVTLWVGFGVGVLMATVGTVTSGGGGPPPPTPTAMSAWSSVAFSARL